MSPAKTFIVGAVAGIIFGAAAFGAILHFLVVGLIIAGSGTALIGMRRLLRSRRARKSLKA